MKTTLQEEMAKMLNKEIQILKVSDDQQEKEYIGKIGIIKDIIFHEKEGVFEYLGDWGPIGLFRDEFELVHDILERTAGTCAICGKKIYRELQVPDDPLTFERYHTYVCGSRFDGAYMRFELCPDCYDAALANLILKLQSIEEVNSRFDNAGNLDELKQLARYILDDLNKK